MNEAHTHSLSLYICCMLIYLNVNVKYRCLYPLTEFKWHDMGEVETLIESTCMWYIIPCILCVKFKRNENKQIYSIFLSCAIQWVTLRNQI